MYYECRWFWYRRKYRDSLILRFSIFHLMGTRYISQRESNSIRLPMKNIIFPKANVRIINDLMYSHWNYWSDYSYSHIFVASFNGSAVSGAKGYYGRTEDLNHLLHHISMKVKFLEPRRKINSLYNKKTYEGKQMQ